MTQTSIKVIYYSVEVMPDNKKTRKLENYENAS